MATRRVEAQPPVERHGAPVRRLPPDRSLGPLERARLAAEIVAAYLRARRELRRAPIAAVLATLRADAAPPSTLGADAAPPSTLRTDAAPPSTLRTDAAPLSTLRTDAAQLSTLRTDAAQPPPPAASALGEANRLGWVVTRTLRLMPGDTRCLARSLVLTTLLARRGIAAKLVIGARAKPEFLAHAWVECEGQPVLSPGDGSFGRLVEL